MKVRVGSLYFYQPLGIDQYSPAKGNGPPLRQGDLVRVINLPGCPKANTMGHCYARLVGSDHNFQLVLTNSLVPFDKFTTATVVSD